MAQAEARQRYVQRQAMVEPVFSALRDRQGLQRFRRNGLAAVRVEFALHAMAYNLSRALACALTSFFSRLINALLTHGYAKLGSITRPAYEDHCRADDTHMWPDAAKRCTLVAY
jgi:hypothetical protein